MTRVPHPQRVFCLLRLGWDTAKPPQSLVFLSAAESKDLRFDRFNLCDEFRSHHTSLELVILLSERGPKRLSFWGW